MLSNGQRRPDGQWLAAAIAFLSGPVSHWVDMAPGIGQQLSSRLSQVLAQFDFVGASVHGRFKLDPEAQTERILRAAANPYTTILGHMTGRQLLRRPGYKVDIEKILAACARRGVAVEVNANPWRLDLD